MNEFLIRTQKGDQGPFSIEQLERFVAAGKIPRSLSVIEPESGLAVPLDSLLAAAADVAPVEVEAPAEFEPPTVHPEGAYAAEPEPEPEPHDAPRRAPVRRSPGERRGVAPQAGGARGGGGGPRWAGDDPHQQRGHSRRPARSQNVAGAD